MSVEDEDTLVRILADDGPLGAGRQHLARMVLKALEDAGYIVTRKRGRR